MNVAAILRQKGRAVTTAAPTATLLEIAAASSRRSALAPSWSSARKPRWPASSLSATSSAPWPRMARLSDQFRRARR